MFRGGAEWSALDLHAYDAQNDLSLKSIIKTTNAYCNFFQFKVLFLDNVVGTNYFNFSKQLHLGVPLRISSFFFPSLDSPISRSRMYSAFNVNHLLKSEGAVPGKLPGWEVWVITDNVASATSNPTMIFN